MASYDCFENVPLMGVILLLLTFVGGCQLMNVTNLFSQSCGNPYFEHKSEPEIIAMSPSERMDLMVLEQMFHAPWDNDETYNALHRHLTEDGAKILPKAIEFINDYDPYTKECKERNRVRLYTAAVYMSQVDDAKLRLRASETGRSAIGDLEEAIVRLREAGSHEPNEDILTQFLESMKGRNIKDGFIKQTIESRYKVWISDSEMIGFCDFLTTLDPSYPSWTHIWGTTVPGASGMTSKEAERYYQAYLTFKKQKKKAE